jgi:hypothetical protein
VAIGSPDVVRDIEGATATGDGNRLEAAVFIDGGHACWSLTYPGRWTWVYDNSTGNWVERQSYGGDGWRGACAIKAFDQWLIGDRFSGKLFALDRFYAREADDPLVMVLRSGCTAAFPRGLTIPRADFDFTAGVGLASGEAPVQTDPVAQIRWSLDGGGRFGNPVTRRLGGQGETGRRVTIHRIGRATGKGVVFELRMSDPVHVGFMGGSLPDVAALAP